MSRAQAVERFRIMSKFGFLLNRALHRVSRLKHIVFKGPSLKQHIAHMQGLASSLEPSDGFKAPKINFSEVASWDAADDFQQADFICLKHPDAKLDSYATAVVTSALRDRPELELVYTDEIFTDRQGKPLEARTKPAFDPVWLKSHDYLGASVFLSRGLFSRLAERAGLGADYSQMREMLTETIVDVPQSAIGHLPYPVFWSQKADAQKNGIPIATDDDETVLPAISIIIPSRNGYELIERTLRGLFEDTDYPGFTVTILDNGSTDPKVFALYREYEVKYANFTAAIKTEPFNFARSINRGLSLAAPGPVLLLNNDIEIIDRDWLRQMAKCLRSEGVGIVGAKLLFPDDTLQHAGVMVGQGGTAGHCFYREPRDYAGPMGRLTHPHSLTCVTGAVMLVSQECQEAIGAWDEYNFAVAYNDVDYCIRAYRAGFRSVWTPFAPLYHHESSSRGPDRDPEKAARFQREKAALKRIHGTESFEDPSHSPWYSKRSSRARFAKRDSLPPIRTWWD